MSCFMMNMGAGLLCCHRSEKISDGRLCRWSLLSGKRKQILFLFRFNKGRDSYDAFFAFKVFGIRLLSYCYNIIFNLLKFTCGMLRRYRKGF